MAKKLTAEEIEYKKSQAEADKKMAVIDGREAKRLKEVADRKHDQALADAKEAYQRAIEKAEDAHKKAVYNAQKKLLAAKRKHDKAVFALARIEAALNQTAADDLSNEQEASNEEIVSQDDTAAIDKVEESAPETRSNTESEEETSFSIRAAKKFPHLFGRKKANAASNESAQATAEEISKEDTAIDSEPENPAVSEAAADTIADDTEQKKIDDFPDDPDDRIERAEEIMLYKVKKAYPHSDPTNEQLIEVIGKIRQEAFSQYAEATKEETDETKKKKKKLLCDAIVDICDKTVEEIKNEKEEK